MKTILRRYIFLYVGYICSCLGAEISDFNSKSSIKWEIIKSEPQNGFTLDWNAEISLKDLKNFDTSYVNPQIKVAYEDRDKLYKIINYDLKFKKDLRQKHFIEIELINNVNLKLRITEEEKFLPETKKYFINENTNKISLYTSYPSILDEKERGFRRFHSYERGYFSQKSIPSYSIRNSIDFYGHLNVTIVLNQFIDKVDNGCPAEK
jgi:hypothetical protein